MPIKEQTRAANLMADLNAEFKRLFPNDPPESLQVDKGVLTALSLNRRDLAEAMQAASRATLSPRDMDRIARHDPKDAE